MRTCPVCQKPLPFLAGPKKVYCTIACRRKAGRLAEIAKEKEAAGPVSGEIPTLVNPTALQMQALTTALTAGIVERVILVGAFQPVLAAGLVYQDIGPSPEGLGQTMVIYDAITAALAGGQRGELL